MHYPSALFMAVFFQAVFAAPTPVRTLVHSQPPRWWKLIISKVDRRQLDGLLAPVTSTLGAVTGAVGSTASSLTGALAPVSSAVGSVTGAVGGVAGGLLGGVLKRDEASQTVRCTKSLFALKH